MLRRISGKLGTKLDDPKKNKIQAKQNKKKAEKKSSQKIKIFP